MVLSMFLRAGLAGLLEKWPDLRVLTKPAGFLSRRPARLCVTVRSERRSHFESPSRLTNVDSYTITHSLLATSLLGSCYSIISRYSCT